MNKENKGKSIVKLSFEKYKKSFVSIGLPLSFFLLFCVASLALAFVSPLSLILTVPFLVIPSLFSLMSINTIIISNPDKTNLGFFLMFKTYFSDFFRGGYRVIVGFLKSFLVYIATSIVFSLIFAYTILEKDPGYVEMISKVGELTNVEEATNLFINYINTNSTFALITLAVSVISFASASAMFVHHISINSIKYYNSLLSPTPMPASNLNIIHKVTMKKIGRQLLKDYYKANWFLLVLFVLSMLGFPLLGYFFLPSITIDQCSILGLSGALVVLLFFLPYHFSSSELIYLKYKNNYVSTFLKLSFESLEQIKKTTDVDPAKEKEIRDYLEDQEKKLYENEDEQKK